MFEKEAEEIANKRCHEIMCYGHCSFSSPKHHRCGEWHREYNCAREGAEFAYNKANEWHYPSKGELPKNQDDIICQIDSELYSDIFEVGYFHITKRIFYTIDGREIFVKAWKEIVLPELPKEKERE